MISLLVLGASHSEVPLIQAAKRLGAHVITVGNDPKGLGISASDEHICVDYSDYALINEIVVNRHIDAICAGCNDFAALTASWVSEQRGWGGVDPFEVTKTIHHKDSFRRLCVQIGVSAPSAAVFSDIASAVDYCIEQPSPLIVKPIDLTGGKGIGVVNDPAQALNIVKTALDRSRLKRIVVEEYIEGSLHSACLFVQGGEVAFSFFADEFSYLNPFMVSGASSPSLLDEVARTSVMTDAEKMIDHLNLKDGIVHIQFIHDGRCPRIIEMCRRPPGDLYLRFVELSTGFDLSDAIVKNAIGHTPVIPARSSKLKPFLRECVMAPNPGLIQEVAYSNVLSQAIRERTVLNQCPTLIQDHLAEKLEIVMLEFASISELRRMERAVNHQVEFIVQATDPDRITE
jgi:biotin carboxylase